MPGVGALAPGAQASSEEETRSHNLQGRNFRLCWFQLVSDVEGPPQVMLDLDGELLTRIEDIVGQWKWHFEDLLYPVLDNTCGVADWRGGSHFSDRGVESVFQLQGDRTAQPPWESLLQGVGEDALTRCQTSDLGGIVRFSGCGPDLYPCRLLRG